MVLDGLPDCRAVVGRWRNRLRRVNVKTANEFVNVNCVTDAVPSCNYRLQRETHACFGMSRVDNGDREV